MNIDYALIDEIWGTSPVEWMTYGELVDYIREAKEEDPDWRPDQTAEEIAKLAFNTMEAFLKENEDA